MQQIILIILLVVLSLNCYSLSFGQNKVIYRQFDWKILDTDNFEIYYYPEEETIAKEGAYLAEKAYKKVTSDLGIYPSELIPLFIYRNHPEFEQTNIIPGFIGEGTGGFTEALKNRIALPITSSERRFEEVIIHEFTHRVQFEVLYGGFGKSYRLLRSVFVPLWFMEGMAEYEAPDADSSYTEMILRDATLYDRLRPINLLDNFNHLDGREVVAMYKQSQTIFDYIANTYGKDKIGALLREYQKPQITINQALKYTIGIGADELNRKFLFYMKEKYWGQVQGKKDAEYYGNPVTLDTKDTLTLNYKPVWSPDNKKIAFFSDKDNYTDIYITDLSTYQTEKLIGYHLEYINSSGNGLSWHPDGKKIAFAAKRMGKYYIYIWDIEDDTDIARFRCNFDVVSSPSISSDGTRITFVGTNAGVSDIYIANLDGSNLIKLTEDRFDDDYPVWSYDSKFIAYVSERNRHRNIYLVSTTPESSGKFAASPLTYGPYESIAPCFSPDGRKIAYVSDKDFGIYNIYIMDIETKEVDRITDIKIGLFTPRFSSDEKKLLFTSFEDGCQNIYIMNLEREDLKSKYVKQEWGLQERGLSPQGTVPVDELSPEPELKKRYANLTGRDYRFNPTLDLLYFLFGYDSSSGFLGGGYMSLSDMLGDHNFELYGSYLADYLVGYQFTYLAFQWRVNFGVSLSRWKTYFRQYDIAGDLVKKYYTDEYGGALLASFPFDQFYRIDCSIGSKIRVKEYLIGDVASSKKIINYVQPSIIRDKRISNQDEIIDGSSNILTIARADKYLGGNTRFTDIYTEHQKYFNITREIFFALRLFTGISTDSDRGEFSIGGSNSLRGFRGGEFIGERAVYLNAEFRFPIVREINFALWPYNWLFIKKLKGGVFTDNGAAWTDPDKFPWERYKNSIGAGLRLHTYLAETMPLIIRFDIAKRTDSSDSEVYYITLGHIF